MPRFVIPSCPKTLSLSALLRLRILTVPIVPALLGLVLMGAAAATFAVMAGSMALRTKATAIDASGLPPAACRALSAQLLAEGKWWIWTETDTAGEPLGLHFSSLVAPARFQPIRTAYTTAAARPASACGAVSNTLHAQLINGQAPGAALHPLR